MPGARSHWLSCAAFFVVDVPFRWRHVRVIALRCTSWLMTAAIGGASFPTLSVVLVGVLVESVA